MSEEKKDEDLYGDLGIEKGASDEDIKKAYRKKAQESHPDKNPDDKESKEKFQVVLRAYTVLSDKEKKAKYDETGKVEGPDEKNMIRESAIKELSVMFVNFTDNNMPEDGNQNIFGLMRSHIHQVRASLHQNIVITKRNIAKKERILKRIRKKQKQKTNDFMSHALQGSIRSLKANLDEYNLKLDLGTVMLALLEDYDYEMDTAPMQGIQTIFITNTT